MEYNFIGISPDIKDEGDLINLGKNAMAQEYSNDVANYLETALLRIQVECEGKPIFVFMHHPTVNFTKPNKRYLGIDKTKNIDEILRKYPQAIVLSGHLHVNAIGDMQVHQESYTSISIPSAYEMYPWRYVD